MTTPAVLRLRVRNAAALDNGLPPMIELRQRNAIIGRLATADWCLPDPGAFISSRHCEIAFEGGHYRLTDKSTNGTFLNGSPERMRGPHLINDGDLFLIGHYEVIAEIEGGDRPPAPPPAPAAWNGWEAPPPPPAQAAPAGWQSPAGASTPSGGGWGPPTPAAPPSSGWGAPEASPAPASSGWGASTSPAAPVPATSGWASSPAPAPAPSAGSGWGGWESPAPPPADPASGWSSPSGGGSSAPVAEDAWGKLADSYDVDWSRGGFGDWPAAQQDAGDQAAFVPPTMTTPTAAQPTTPPTAADGDRRTVARRAEDEALNRFLDAAGLERAMIKGQELEVMAAAGTLLHRLVAGLVVMVEARARAKSQMGAKSTVFDRDGNNPIKFARSPEGALAQLLNPQVPGYMPADRAVEDSFRDLQTHQIATLKAMQGALRATLDQFSPAAIRARVEKKTGLTRLMPGARDAALWQAYEREFGGVARDSDEAFMDRFAKEFRKAYEEQSSR